MHLICRDGDLPLIVAIDLQPMAPIEGVIQVQGDITNARTAEVVKVKLYLASNTVLRSWTFIGYFISYVTLRLVAK